MTGLHSWFIPGKGHCFGSMGLIPAVALQSKPVPVLRITE